MRIALIGYGKMGQAIEQLATRRGHQVVLRIGSGNREDLSNGRLKEADVAIEFTRPEAAPGNVRSVLGYGIPVVCGTTGWNEGLPDLEAFCLEQGTAFLHASNFSIGVNLFFELNKLLARLMNHQPDYEVHLEEIHHTQKKDAPSGTAITLAEQIIGALDRKERWVLEGTAAGVEDLQITSIREDQVPGTHRVFYQSPVDTLELVHTAHNREGFALGAVLAAEFIAGKKGIFQMSDVLGIPAA